MVHEDGCQVGRKPDGELGVRRPDGRLLPHVPPPPTVSRDPVAAVRAKNEACGIHIEGRTSMPGWPGGRLDLGWAIGVFLPLAPGELYRKSAAIVYVDATGTR